MSSQRSRFGAWLPVALAATTLAFFVQTAFLSYSENRSREMLAVSTRASGWAVYQAMIELARTKASLEIAIAAPTAIHLADLSFRFELLLSRLPLLYASEEGRSLAGYEQFRPEIQDYETRIAGYVDALAASDATDGGGPVAAALADWAAALKPLDGRLQAILLTSIRYKSEIHNRLGEGSATLPLALMFLSGGALAALLILQNARDRLRLAEVTRAREREEAVRDDFRAAIETMPVVVAILDPATRRVSFLNAAAAELISPSPDAPEWARLADILLRTAEPGAASAVTIGFPRDDGRFTSLRGARQTIIWEGRAQLLVGLADATLANAATLQVIQSAKLATLGEMASAVAHELSQPLAVIRMATANLRRLLDSGGPADAVAAKLERIETQIERARRITDLVRRYAHAPSEVSTAFPVRSAIELASGFVSEQLRVAGARLVLQIDLPPDLMVIGEETLFEQTIVNLLVNARDAFETALPGADAPAPGVTVAAALAPAAGSEEPQVVITVVDNAGGIAPEVIGRLFEPFATTKPAEKGIGLGLSLSRTVIDSMGGTITAANVDGGACFTIRLPLHTAVPRPAETAASDLALARAAPPGGMAADGMAPDGMAASPSLATGAS